MALGDAWAVLLLPKQKDFLRVQFPDSLVSFSPSSMSSIKNETVTTAGPQEFTVQRSPWAVCIFKGTKHFPSQRFILKKTKQNSH